MSDQTTLQVSPYPIGQAWCEAHSKATRYIVDRAHAINGGGKKARMQSIIEEMRKDGEYFDLTAERGYGFDHRDRSEVTRHIMAVYGVDFVIRKSKSDAQAVEATPKVRQLGRTW